MTKDRIKRLAAILTAAVLGITMLPGISAPEDVYAGEGLDKCGSNLLTNIGSDPLELSITLEDPSWHNGLMDNFTYSGGTDAFPWASYRDSIYRIVIGNGVTKISSNAFRDMPALREVVLPSSINWVGINAFSNNGKTKIFYDGSESWWESLKTNPDVDSSNSLLYTDNVTFLNKGSADLDFCNGKVDARAEMGGLYYSCFITCLDKMVQKGIITVMPHKEGYDGTIYDIDKDGTGDIGAVYKPSTSSYIYEVMPGTKFLGEHTVWLTEEANNELFGVQRYSGINFNITNDLLYADITVSPSSAAYNGSAQKPKVKAVLHGKTLKSGTDYTVSYSNNKNPGQATAVLKGKGKYKGEGYGDFLVCFKDVPVSHSYSNAVYWALGKKIAAGYSGSRTGTFGIRDDITRGQVVTFLWRAAGKPSPMKNTQTFNDVPVSHSFYTAIQWASDYGITEGYKNGNFGVNDKCTRGQIMTFLWRFFGRPEPSGSTQSFSDVPTDHNYYKAIQWAYEAGVTAGYEDGSFGVRKGCTRGHCVTFLYRQMFGG